METPSNYGENGTTSHNKTVESQTPQSTSSTTYLVNNNCPDTSIDSCIGSKVDENNVSSVNETDKFDVTGSTALVDEVCNNTSNNKSRVICDVKCSGDGDVSTLILDKNQTLSDNKGKETKQFCCCPYDRMSEADTEYLDFSQRPPTLKCNNFDENCFCHNSDEMSFTTSSGKNVIKRNYTSNRRLIKIRIKTSNNKECSVEGESTDNGIKICISPRERDKNGLNETYTVRSSRTEVESSGLETDYEFRKTLKNELKRSPASIKVLKYLESLSESRKKSPEKIAKQNRINKRTCDPILAIEAPPYIPKSDVIHTKPNTGRRSKSKTPPKRTGTPPSIMSLDEDEFHDCCDKIVMSGTDTTVTSEYEDTTESLDTSNTFDDQLHIKNVTKDNKDTPLITITQEMSAQMIVTSKFEINKEKLKRLSDARERRQSRESRESPDKIIDDNFCNEILDKMNQLRVGLQKEPNSVSNSESESQSDDESLNKTKTKNIPLNSTLETSTSSNMGPEKPPRTFAYRRSQDNAEKRPKTIDIPSSMESLDMYLYEEMKQLKLFKFNQSRQVPKVINIGNGFTGGWKTSPSKSTKEVGTSPLKRDNASAIGWVTSPIQSPKKTTPGWIQPTQATIPEDIVNMLHYSDDEVKKRSILSSNATAEPQQQINGSYIKHQTIAGPKLDIDTVDAVIHTPSSSSNHRFEEFSSNLRSRSTPRRKENVNDAQFAQKFEPYFDYKRTKAICKKFLQLERGGGCGSGTGTSSDSKSVNPLPSMEDFLNKERGEICKKCCREVNPAVKRQRFHQKAFSRTKSLFVASKKKISDLRHSKEKMDKPRFEEVLSDSDPYCTPENGNSPYKSPDKSTRKSWHSMENPPVVPKHAAIQKNFNYNAPLPQSPQRNLLDVTVSSHTNTLQSKLKLSPKNLFGIVQNGGKTSSPSSPNNSFIPQQGEYKSFEDQDQNLAATMGEILSELRKIIEGNQPTSERSISGAANLSVSGANALLQSSQEPDYAEISQTQSKALVESPHTKKLSPPTIRIERNNNEYIIVNNDPNAIYATVVKKDDESKSSSNTHTYRHSTGTRNNNNPSSHHSTPTKPTRKKKSSRRRITFNVQQNEQQKIPSNTTVQASIHSNAIASSSRTTDQSTINRFFGLKSNSCSSLHDPPNTTMEKSVSKNLFGSDQCIKVAVKEVDFPRKYRVIHEKYQKQSDTFENEMKQMAYDTNIMDQYLESLNKILNKKLVVDDKNIKKATEDFILKEVCAEREGGHEQQNDEKTCQVDKDQLSTGGTYKSFGFPRPDNKRSDDQEQYFSLNYSSGDVDSQNNETGYDEVDFKPYVKEPIIQTNLLEEIICEEEFDHFFNTDEKQQRQVTSLDDTLTTSQSTSSGSRISSTNASPAKLPRRRGSLYRSFKNSLRSSFRKGRDFIKHEQDKLVNLFDKGPNSDEKNSVPKPARSFVNLDEYKKYYNDQNAEQIYKNWSEKLKRGDSHADLHDKRMLELINQITAQRQVKKQLRNALEICRYTKEFDSSSELVEAERLLLVSNLKESAAKKELMEMENDLYANVKQNHTNDVGMIALSDFEFPLKDAAMYDTLYNYFYICVATYKDQVKASYAKEREGNKVSFRGFDIKFWEVEPGYQIKIEVFVLSLRKNNRGAGERRSSLTKTSKKSPCRFFSGNSVEKSPTAKKQTELEFSQFVSQGFLFVTSSSFVSYSESLIRRQIPDAHIDLPYYSSSNFHQYLKKSGDHHINCIEDYRSFRMNQIIYNSHMTGQIEMGIKSEVIFDGSKISGFLTIGESINGSITWNRRWCKVDGLCLNFWNYPQEAADGKTPVEVIDVSKCENDYIYQADREICPRPRAIVIELADCSTTIESKPGYYFLATDTKEELRDWLRELNKILRFVRDWKL